MPELDRSKLNIVGLNAHARARATWPRCPACAFPLHPLVQRAGIHPLCSDLPLDAYDHLAGWADTNHENPAPA